MKPGTRWLVVVLAGLMSVSTAVWADDDDDRQRARQLRERGDILPLQTILEKAQAVRPGRVLEVEFDEEHGQYIYEVQILSSEGEVWEIEINAVTGKPVEMEKK